MAKLKRKMTCTCNLEKRLWGVLLDGEIFFFIYGSHNTFLGSGQTYNSSAVSANRFFFSFYLFIYVYSHFILLFFFLTRQANVVSST